ncbi:MAG: DUF72 domain-containing protein [Candidatus Limnocylindria bacterium]
MAPDRAGGRRPLRGGSRATIKVGTCSWTDPTLIASGWYPQDVAKKAEDRLRFYAERFPLVENDAAYYAIPDAKQSALWAARTPDGFTMSFKAFAPLTTHPTDPKRLPREIREGLSREAAAKRRVYPKDLGDEALRELFARYWVALDPLRKAGKLGAVLLQYPEWFVISRESKAEILRARELLPDDRIAVEFRNATWMSERNRAGTLGFLAQHGLSYVAVDEPQGFPSSVPPVAAVTAPELAIVRFHGRNANTWKKPGLSAAERFDYLYTERELKEWVPEITRLAAAAREVHLLMNNCYGDKAVRNAEQLAELVNAA